MHNDQRFIDKTGCARHVERWLSEKPSRGFNTPVLVFTKRKFIRMSESHISYEIELHRGRHFLSESIDSLTRIAKVLRLPRLFSRMEAELGGEQEATVPIGLITYRMDGNCAITEEVFPKTMSENSRKFGTYAELVCTHDLQKTRAASSILTPVRSSKFRRAQMKGCNLKVNAETPLMEWKQGLSRRLRMHSLGTRAERMAQNQSPAPKRSPL